jgi:multidrug transporter EmrE-like cation transporter
MVIIILMILVVLLNVCGHVFLKVGMNQVGQVGARPFLEFALAAISNPFVLLGLAGYVSSVTGYVIVLSKTQLSVAYPILMSSGYALVVLVAFLWLKEPFSILKWFGLILIFAGVIFVSLKG